jgi:hypothetical protein
MRWLLKRWYFWLGLVLLLGIVGSVALILANPSRITQENFDRIQYGMSLAQVEAILGEEERGDMPTTTFYEVRWIHRWEHGPNWITVGIWNGSAVEKNLHLATTWETLHWYAKKGAAKIGVKWP